MPPTTAIPAGTPNSGLAAGLAYVDKALGELTSALRDKKLLDSTLIIIASKHGQSPIDPATFQALDDDPYTKTPGYGFHIADDPTELIYWRQGRSLPYGEGVTFWALGEMVKAQAGILETDSPDQAEQKLQSSVVELVPGSADAQWVQGHLRPLVGLSSATEAARDRREEAFTAWRRYFEGLAERSPLTLVFEDLHWADDNLLDFVEHLVDWASGVPMLILCNARPELFERRPGWAGGKRHATTLSLAPLSDEATAQLLSSLSDRPLMAAETQQALLTRAGGNPLYAEQYVRMLAERGDADELPLPETVQGIIAARLDALPIEEKTLLQTAAVMGKVFWLSAVATAAGVDRRTAEVRLHSLERKDFVQRARRSSVADEAEYAFLHVLVRDVAYGQIPRGQRAQQHRLAAEWMGSLGRTEDHAEMLAYHYLSALELQRAAGQPIDAVVSQRARASAAEAGDRAFSLNALASATRFYETALQLASEGSSERAHLLFKLGRTRVMSGDTDAALLTAAGAELLALGERGCLLRFDGQRLACCRRWVVVVAVESQVEREVADRVLGLFDRRGHFVPLFERRRRREFHPRKSWISSPRGAIACFRFPSAGWNPGTLQSTATSATHCVCPKSAWPPYCHGWREQDSILVIEVAGEFGQA